MHSSISSSDHGYYERHTPAKPWMSVLAVAAVVVILCVVAWENRVRAMGYAPTYSDTPNLWAEQRERAEHGGPDQLVFVGASRTLFDIDLDTFAQATGGPPPIQLATVGSNPLIVLEDLAADPSYAGTTIVGVVPGLFAAAAGPPVAMPTRFVEHYHKRSIADQVELEMALWLQDRFAFINPDLALAGLLERRLDLPNREDAYAPELPGYMYRLDRARRARMIDEVAHDPVVREEIRQIWVPLFSPPPKPAVFTDEQWQQMMEDGWTANLGRLAAAVQAIRSRGGRVFFVRHPSSGEVAELEDRYTPRELFWQRILDETGSPGIYFSDHPSLRGFDCPEWSHLSAEDSVEYSRRLLVVMQAEGLL